MEILNEVLSVLVFLAGIVAVLTVVGYATIFKVDDVHYGLPSSFFSGRYKGKDRLGKLPLHKPYAEGIHFKLPWWRIKSISREVRVKKIKLELPVAGGGTVEVEVTIQYRASCHALYRFEEVDDQAIENGLVSEIEQFIGKSVAHYGDGADGSDKDKEGAFEQVLTRKAELNLRLSKRLQDPILNPDREDGEPELKRELFGKDVSYTEHSYGVEVLKVAIDNIDPSEEIKRSRDEQKKEEYEKKSQSTEFTHLMEKVFQIREKYSTISEADAIKMVWAWQGKMSYDVKDIKLSDPESIIAAAASVIAAAKEASGK